MNMYLVVLYFANFLDSLNQANKMKGWKGNSTIY